MKSSKKNGRLLGLLFLISFILGVFGTSLRGLTNPEPDTAAFLNNIVEKSIQMQAAIALDIIGSVVAVLIALFLFPLIKKYSLRLALSYFGIALVSFTVIVISNVIHIGMLHLASNFVTDVQPNEPQYTALSTMLYESYYWVHFLMLMLYSIGGLQLFYFSLKTAIIPKWLAFWGILANLLVFIGGALQIIGIPVSFYFFLQNGIFILAFIGWLLLKGFKVAAARPTS